jgi:hypothetical protein
MFENGMFSAAKYMLRACPFFAVACPYFDRAQSIERILKMRTFTLPRRQKTAGAKV